MLPEVNLNPVSREDVDRIAGWLSNTEVSSRWFGHYACGDPVHRGYEPSIMLESSDSMWEQVFLLDQNRLIFSIYSEETGHIGECQLLCDGKGGGELSLLIGRRDVWHKGYGTSAMLGYKCPQTTNPHWGYFENSDSRVPKKRPPVQLPERSIHLFWKCKPLHLISVHQTLTRRLGFRQSQSLV